jgi:hypothetical protein
MTLYPPLWAQNTAYPALADRMLITMFDRGVLWPDDLRVTPRLQGAAMSINIAAGTCVLPGPFGDYLCRSDALEERSVAPAPAAGTSRVDRVIARVYDNQATGAGDPVVAASWDIEVVTGTPQAQNPIPPAEPDWSITLAYLAVDANVVSILDANITDYRTNARPNTRLCHVEVTETYQSQTLIGGLVGPDVPFTLPSDRWVIATAYGRHQRANATGMVQSSVAIDGQPTAAQIRTRHDVVGGPGNVWAAGTRVIAISAGHHRAQFHLLSPTNNAWAQLLASSALYLVDAGPASANIVPVGSGPLSAGSRATVLAADETPTGSAVSVD